MEDFGVWFRFARAAEAQTNDHVTRLLDSVKGSHPEIAGIHEDIAIMIAQIEDMTRLLPACIVNCRSSQMDECESLAQEVRRQAKILTRKLVSTHKEGQFPPGVIRFPLRLERIADELDSILTCCRIKARDAIEFSEPAHMELRHMLVILLDMLERLRDVMTIPNREVVNHIMAQGERVIQLLGKARLFHWMRLESGQCTPEAGSLFLDMLDSLKSSNEYVQKMAATFSGLFNAEEAPGNAVSETASS